MVVSCFFWGRGRSYVLSSPFFSLDLLSCNPDAGSGSRRFLLLPSPQRFLSFIFIARTLQPFLPSSARIELMDFSDWLDLPGLSNRWVDYLPCINRVTCPYPESYIRYYRSNHIRGHNRRERERAPFLPPPPPPNSGTSAASLG